MVIEGLNIIIFKREVYEEIDCITQKYKDSALAGTDPAAADAVSSDADERLDGNVLARYVDFRHAKVRRRLKHAIIQEALTRFDDAGHPIEAPAGLAASDQMPAEPCYSYRFNATSGLTGETIEWLATLIHEYLVRGALYDWFRMLGMGQQASLYADCEQLLEDIDNSARPEGLVMHRPFPYIESYRSR